MPRIRCKNPRTNTCGTCIVWPMDAQDAIALRNLVKHLRVQWAQSSTDRHPVTRAPSHAHAYAYMLILEEILRNQAMQASARSKTAPRKARVRWVLQHSRGCAHAYTAFTWYPRMSGHDVHNSTHSKVMHPYWCTAGTARAKTKTDRHEGLSRARNGVDCARAGTSPEKQGCKRTIAHNPQRRTIQSIPHACPDAYSEGCTATPRERVWLQRGKTRSLERMPAHPDMTRHDDHT